MKYYVATYNGDSRSLAVISDPEGFNVMSSAEKWLKDFLDSHINHAEHGRRYFIVRKTNLIRMQDPYGFGEILYESIKSMKTTVKRTVELETDHEFTTE